MSQPSFGAQQYNSGTAVPGAQQYGQSQPQGQQSPVLGSQYGTPNPQSYAYPTGYWGWVVATLMTFPILLFWQLPTAAKVYPEFCCGNYAQAEAYKKSVKKFGIIAVGVGIFFFVFFFLLQIILVMAASSS